MNPIAQSAMYDQFGGTAAPARSKTLGGTQSTPARKVLKLGTVDISMYTQSPKKGDATMYCS